MSEWRGTCSPSCLTPLHELLTLLSTLLRRMRRTLSAVVSRGIQSTLIPTTSRLPTLDQQHAATVLQSLSVPHSEEPSAASLSVQRPCRAVAIAAPSVDAAEYADTDAIADALFAAIAACERALEQLGFDAAVSDAGDVEDAAFSDAEDAAPDAKGSRRE